MNRSKRSEYFWLFIIAGCVALFVVHRERPIHRAEASETYDRGAMAELVRETQSAPVIDPNDDIVTGSIVRPATRPVARKSSYYVALGSYGSIDEATRRYLDLARAEPALERSNKLKIETISPQGDGTFHRVRMGNFASVNSAKAACARVGVSESRCAVIEVH
ncbi:MAG TPA: SPOR domain-containing protein [Parvibaculum sp.]|jgi:hypothetical protein